MKLFILLSIAAVAVTGQSFCKCNEKYTGSDCSDCAIKGKDWITAVGEHLFKGYWNTTEEEWMRKPVLEIPTQFEGGTPMQIYKNTVWMKIDGARWAEGNIATLATQVVTESFKKEVCLPDVVCETIGSYNASNPVEARTFDQKKTQFLSDPESWYPILGINRTNSTNPPTRSLVINKIYASRVYDNQNLYIPVMDKKSGCALSESNLQYGADSDLRAYLQEQKYVRETEEQIICYGQGTWDSATHECQCDGNQDEDKFCGECTDSFINWPQCNESPCDGADTCSGHGKCDKSDRYTSFLGFGVNSYRTAYESIKVNYNNAPLLKGENQGKYCSGKSRTNDVPIMWLLNTNEPGRKCCNTDDPNKGYCEWDEDCAGGRVCIKSGYEACSRTPPGGGNTKIVGCSPAQSCCHGQCCNSNEACQEIEGGTGVVLSYDQSDLVRMEWSTPKGVIPEDYRYKCTAGDTMDAAAAIKSWVTPFLIMLAVGTSTILVMTTGGFDLGEKKITIPALIVICSSFFLIFSSLQTFAIVASLGSILALGVQKSQSPNKFLFALLFQFFFLAILGGGLGVGDNLISSPGGDIPESVLGSLSQNDCSEYFRSFEYDSAVTRPWDSGDAYYLHCSEDYLAAVQFFGTVMFCSFFIQTIATGAVMVGQNAK